MAKKKATKDITKCAIIVFYISVGNMEPEDAKIYVERIKKQCDLSEYNGVLSFYIPTRESHSRVEVLHMPQRR